MQDALTQAGVSFHGNGNSWSLLRHVDGTPLPAFRIAHDPTPRQAHTVIEGPVPTAISLRWIGAYGGDKIQSEREPSAHYGWRHHIFGSNDFVAKLAQELMDAGLVTSVHTLNVWELKDTIDEILENVVPDVQDNNGLRRRIRHIHTRASSENLDGLWAELRHELEEAFGDPDVELRQLLASIMTAQGHPLGKEKVTS